MLNTYQRSFKVGDVSLWKTFIAIAELKLDPTNPREITDIKKKDLDYFIDKYELLAPLLVDGRPEKEGRLLGGNNRFERYVAKGKTEVWVEVRAPRDDAEAFEIATISNMQFASYVKQLLIELTKQANGKIDISKLRVPVLAKGNLKVMLEKLNNPPAAKIAKTCPQCGFEL